MEILSKNVKVKVNEAGVANHAKKRFKMSYCLTDCVMPRRRTTSCLGDGLRCVSTQKNLFVKPFKNQVNEKV